MLRRNSLSIAICSATGLATYLVVRPVLTSESLTIVTLASAVLLFPGLAFANWIVRRHSRRTLWLLAACPYPYNLALLLYMRREQWVPAALESSLNDPTAFFLFVCAALFLSLPWTAYALARAGGMEPGRFRPAAILLFVLTAAAASLPDDPQWSMDLLQNVLPPLAVVLFSGVYGGTVGHAPDGVGEDAHAQAGERID